MELLSLLAPLRAHGGARTHGLDDATVTAFAARHADLRDAIAAAGTEYAHVRAELPELMDLDERAQITAIQGGQITFDAPTRYVLKTRDKARLYKLPDTYLEEVGLESLTFGGLGLTGVGRDRMPAGPEVVGDLGSGGDGEAVDDAGALDGLVVLDLAEHRDDRHQHAALGKGRERIEVALPVIGRGVEGGEGGIDRGVAGAGVVRRGRAQQGTAARSVDHRLVVLRHGPIVSPARLTRVGGWTWPTLRPT